VKCDVVVVGASLAGSACVRELNRLGVDAVALDRAAFPSDKVCGGFLSPGAVAILDEMDLAHKVREAGAAAIHHVRLHAGAGEVVLDLPSPGLSVSRRTLDAIVRSGVECRRLGVQRIVRNGAGFRVFTGDAIDARFVVDASGKQSRLSRAYPARHFGVQFYAPARVESEQAVMDFWFFGKGYGGIASVEGGRANACFLIHQDALPRYIASKECLVTGPLAYAREPFRMFAVGDAAGMIDPFCGEGMRHALDTGRMAARLISEGLRCNENYEALLARYRAERSGRWASRRRLAAAVRGVLHCRALVERGIRLGAAQRLLKSFWK
jgi:flavin-dependent dehydrogenase